MPLPLIIGAGLAAAGIGGSIHGAVKTKAAKGAITSAESRHKKNLELLEEQAKATTEIIDKLGEDELQIFSDFKKFAVIIKEIENQPEFKPYDEDSTITPKYDPVELREISEGIELFIANTGGEAPGIIATHGTRGIATIIGGMAPIMSLGSSAAKIIGSGTLVARGGAVVGGAILGPATLGASFLVGGVISSLTASKLSDKADDAWKQMIEDEEKINKICDYLKTLRDTASRYDEVLLEVKKIYDEQLLLLSQLVLDQRKINWNVFTEDEKLTANNSVLLTGLLYDMCKVELVISDENEQTVNIEAVDKSIANANTFIKSLRA